MTDKPGWLLRPTPVPVLHIVMVSPIGHRVGSVSPNAILPPFIAGSGTLGTSAPPPAQIPLWSAPSESARGVANSVDK